MKILVLLISSLICFSGFSKTDQDPIIKKVLVSVGTCELQQINTFDYQITQYKLKLKFETTVFDILHQSNDVSAVVRGKAIIDIEETSFEEEKTLLFNETKSESAESVCLKVKKQMEAHL